MLTMSALKSSSLILTVAGERVKRHAALMLRIDTTMVFGADALDL